MNDFIGQINLFPYFDTLPLLNWLKCNGENASIEDYSALYSLIGTTFGGDGTTTFATPDLPFAGSDDLHYFIAAFGIYPDPQQQTFNSYTGQICLFPYDFSPTGWLGCDGSGQSIKSYNDLYSIIGTTFGGDGSTTFNLPNLASPDGGTIQYYVATKGIFPSQGGTTAMEVYIGQIGLFPFGISCDSWIECNGALLDIDANEVFYSLIGINFGGDGVNNFAVPKLPSPDGGKSKYFISSDGIYPLVSF
jgi:microcystin-dependent protein